MSDSRQIWSEFDHDCYRKKISSLFPALTSEQIEVHILCVRTFDPVAARLALDEYYRGSRKVPTPTDIVTILRPDDRVQPPATYTPLPPAAQREAAALRLVALWRERRQTS